MESNIITGGKFFNGTMENTAVPVLKIARPTLNLETSANYLNFSIDVKNLSGVVDFV